MRAPERLGRFVRGTALFEDADLRRLLVTFRETVVRAESAGDRRPGILRRAMIDPLVATRPRLAPGKRPTAVGGQGGPCPPAALVHFWWSETTRGRSRSASSPGTDAGPGAGPGAPVSAPGSGAAAAEASAERAALFADRISGLEASLPRLSAAEVRAMAAAAPEPGAETGAPGPAPGPASVPGLEALRDLPRVVSLHQK